MIAVLIIFTVLPVVQAIGLNMDYLPDNTLKLHAGESAIYGVRIPNIADEEVRVVFTVESSGDVVRVIDPEDVYIIPPKKLDTAVNMRVIIPEDAEVGKRYSVNMRLAGAPGEEGQVRFSQSAGSGFTVEVIGEGDASTEIDRVEGFVEPSSSSPHLLSISVFVVVVLCIAALVLYRKFRKKEKI